MAQTEINQAIKTVIEWSAQRFTSRKLMVTEGARTGYLNDEVTTTLADWLKDQHKTNPMVDGQAKRGYEINLENGLIVGVTRQKHGYSRSTRKWCSYCRIQYGYSISEVIENV